MEKMHESEDPERSLRLALANEEFELYGQPIVSVLQPGRFPMAEVLVRMRAEEDYMLPPGDFIPVFEHYGMMPELDRWVSAHAIRMLARSKAIPVLCLNLHPQTFLDEGFAENMAHELSRAHVEGSSLVFEFEHADILADETGAQRLAEELRRRGCQICVCGVGERSESLRSIKLMHPTIIKVDGGLIRNLLDDKTRQIKLKALTRIAGTLQTQVVAEFVEDPEVLAQLRAYGVDFAQGFGVFEPTPLKRLLFPQSRPTGPAP
jgi:EAL domain-containing protein (putative c-di-GMP-specific phosphodiesterase class I)